MKSLFKSKIGIHFMAVLFMAVSMLFAVSFDVKAAVPAPTGVTQTDAGESSVKIKWNAVFTDEDARYYWRISESNAFAASRSKQVGSIKYSDCTANISGLEAGKTYFVQVGTSLTNDGDKAPADTVWSQAVRVVTVPNNVERSTIVSTGAKETSISLGWKAVPGATGYKVRYYIEGTDSQNASEVSSNAANVTISNLKKNTKYRITVSAVRKDGEYEAKSYGSTVYDIPTLPTKITGVDCEYFNPSVKEGSAEFKWDQNAVADGYELEIYKYNGKKALLKVTTGRYDYSWVKKSKLKTRQFYKVRVRGFVNIANNQKVYGTWSSYDYFARCTGTDTNLKKSGNKLKASWKKVPGASGYTIYMSNKYNSGYKKMGTTKKTSYTINKKLQKGKYYYVRVVPYYKKGKTYAATVNSKTQYSAYAYYYKSGHFYSWN